MWAEHLRNSSRLTIAALIPHYAASLLLQRPLLTDAIAEWLMARTPNRYALAILDTLGAWAKPAAATGGLAALGFAMFLALQFGWWLVPVFAVAYTLVFGNPGWTFWIPAMAGAWWLARQRQPAAGFDSGRRSTLVRIASPMIMLSGTAAVAWESRSRDERFARSAVTPVPLLPAPPSVADRESFAPGLVRSIVTPTPEFYGMSKNTVDPVLDPQQWRLGITIDGSPIREWTYSQLLSLPRVERYVALRCISNTLKSNLMGCAHWSGVPLRALVETGRIPSSVRELAIIGADGHDDSLPLDYALSDGPLFALGMNGMTLDRTHGFPVRLLAPRYYGLKSVKWISELRFVSKPYYGTWPKLGYTREPLVHTVCYIDKMRRSGEFVEAGGIAIAGDRGVKAVQLRLDGQTWVDATLEAPLAAQTWVRWRGRVPATTQGSTLIEARAMDGTGRWQSAAETPLFPDGVDGPTVRRLAL